MTAMLARNYKQMHASGFFLQSSDETTKLEISVLSHFNKLCSNTPKLTNER